MKTRLPLLPAILIAAGLLTGPGAGPTLHAQGQNQGWNRSLVSLEVTQKQYDYLQPWVVRSRSGGGKNGLVIGTRSILTTAQNLNDLTLVRIQRGGRGPWANGRVRWIDYHANLAIIEPDEETLLDQLEPKPLAKSDSAIESNEIQIVRWNNGKLEARKAEFSEFNVATGPISFVPHVHLYATSELGGAGQAEVVISDGKVVGLVSAITGNTCKIIPSSFITSILQARENNQYQGLGFFEFVWQPAENPSVLDYLKLEGEPRGVLVIDVPSKRGQKSALKEHDIILQVDGFNIDTQGDYLDPDYGHLSLENLCARNRWAGDKVPLRIWRDGKVMDVDYTLPRAEFSDQLVPDHTFDREPEYLVAGGLVFQPLTDDFLGVWGDPSRGRAPFRLAFYNQEEASTERPALVILSLVLPDSVNLGYQDYRYLVVDKVNGREVHYLKEIQEALKTADDGFHVIEFEQGSQVSRMILDAALTGEATTRVLERYGIPKDHHFN